MQTQSFKLCICIRNLLCHFIVHWTTFANIIVYLRPHVVSLVHPLHDMHTIVTIIISYLDEYGYAYIIPIEIM